MGALRFFLAVLVVVSHLGGSEYVSHFGFYAVRCFFVLSGFVMTAALQEVYGFDWRRFFANRLLRLLPLYYAACVLTLVLVWSAPEQAALLTTRWRLPDDPFEILLNLLLLPLVSPSLKFRLLIPAWSLAVEMVMYGCLFLAFARSERAARLFFLLGVGYHGWLLAAGAPFSMRYFTITSVLISFPLGSLIYFWKRRGAVEPTSAHLPAICVAWAANVFIGPGLGVHYADGLGYYLNTVLSAVLVAAIFDLRVDGFWAKLDGWLGELS